MAGRLPDIREQAKNVTFRVPAVDRAADQKNLKKSKTSLMYSFFVFFLLAEDVPNLVDFHFPCLTMLLYNLFLVIYSFYLLHVWELLA